MFPQDEHNEALKEIDGASDRAAAIIAASAVETRLEQAIKHGMIREANIEKAMFRASGPLGSFEAKIQLARLIGVVSPRAHKEMKTIKEIRNLFAHDLGIIDFNTIRIRDKCLSLTMAREITLSDEEILEIGKKVRRGEIDLLKLNPHRFGVPGTHTRFDASPRGRYEVTCQVFSILLFTPQTSTLRQPVPRI